MIFLAAPLYAVATTVLVAVTLAFLRGGLDAGIAWVSLATGAFIAGFACWRRRHERGPWIAPGSWGWASLLLFALFSLRAFLWLIFHDEDAIKVLSPNNTGDMSLHLTYIHYLANGAPVWPDNPIHFRTKLQYPVGVDLFNSLLVLVGVDTIRGLIWVGLAGCVLAAGALLRWGGAFAVTGFLCNGGFLGLEFFRRWQLLDYQTESSWPGDFPEVGWKSIPLALFVTQRGFLFALPAGLLLLLSWRDRFFSRGVRPALPRWGELLLYASMPIFHLHTFLFLSFLLGVWFLVHAPARIELARLLGFAFLPASALVLLVTGFFQGASVIGLHPGWMQNGQNFFRFWLMNFGLFPLFVAALCFVLFRRTEIWPAALIFPALGVFLLCCIIRFAPWEWDNTKLMVWSYLAVLPALWTHLIARWRMPLKVCACLLLFLSGFVSLLGGIDTSHRGYPIATRSELDGVASAVRAIPRAERFAGYPTYNHPLLLLGHPMVLGYPGHLWSHGLEFDESLPKLKALLTGEPNWRDLAKHFGVRYIFWGNEEREHYVESAQPWKAEAALVAAGDWGEIYDLSLPAVPVNATRADATTPGGGL